MAIHHPTPPLGGGERPRLPSAQVGPVTQAIRAMRAAEPMKVGDRSPTFDRGSFTQGIRALSRTEVEDLIGGLIDLLDAMDGDADLEDGADLEVENEHGGDVQDEPHDPEEDGDVHEIATAVAGFDGTNYLRTSLNRRVNIIPSSVVEAGPGGANHIVRQVLR